MLEQELLNIRKMTEIDESEEVETISVAYQYRVMRMENLKLKLIQKSKIAETRLNALRMLCAKRELENKVLKKQIA